MSSSRRPAYINPDAQRWQSTPSADLDRIYDFHKQMDGYKPTELIPLGTIAEELGLCEVYVKHEGDRFGLPSFKILGASWGTYRAVVRAYGLAEGATIEDIRAATAVKKMTLFAATDGNHGRAVGRLGKMFGLPTKIFVPGNMDVVMIADIESEGAKVTNTGKSYDEAIGEAERGSMAETGLLIQDCAFEGYEELPKWIVDGYATCLREVDIHLEGKTADLVIVPTGVGSLAQSVVTHYRRQGSPTTVMAVEPDTAACLWKSLQKGDSTSMRTTPTIMAGLDCGTVSTIAWPILQAGTGASVTVADWEAHEAVLELRRCGVRSGPCGAASLAALRRLSAEDKKALKLGKDSIVVLLSTEAARGYEVPRDVRVEDPKRLLNLLEDIKIHSIRPVEAQQPVDTAMAKFVMAWFEHRDIECHWLERGQGCPSVVGIVRGNGGGKRLMLHSDLNKAHASTSTVWRICNGLAANLLALAGAVDLRLEGDVILAAAANGEDAKTGTQEILEAGWSADGAIMMKPTGKHPLHENTGVVTMEVEVHRTPGSASSPGSEAIMEAAYFLVELDKFIQSQEKMSLESRNRLRNLSILQPKDVNAHSTTPSCTVVLEWSTDGGETAERVEKEVQGVLDSVSRQNSRFRSSLRLSSRQGSVDLSTSHQFYSLVTDSLAKVGAHPTKIPTSGDRTNCTVLMEASIPTLMMELSGADTEKGSTEYSKEVESVKTAVNRLLEVAKAFCD